MILNLAPLYIFQTYSVVVGWNTSVVIKSVDVNFSEVEALLVVDPNAVVDSSVEAISVSQIYTCAHYIFTPSSMILIDFSLIKI